MTLQPPVLTELLYYDGHRFALFVLFMFGFYPICNIFNHGCVRLYSMFLHYQQ